MLILDRVGERILTRFETDMLRLAVWRDRLVKHGGIREPGTALFDA